jgi:uncharacterized protein YbbK (DUF523 family)
MEKIVIVSSCLLGMNTKYDGGNNRDENILALSEQFLFVPLCPEQLGGLSTPRPPSEIINGNVVTIDGIDVTENYLRGAKEALYFAKLYNVQYAILKDGSPSCGSNYIYDGSFSGKKVQGMGVTVKLFKENGIKVFSEHDIKRFLDETKK